MSGEFQGSSSRQYSNFNGTWQKVLDKKKGRTSLSIFYFSTIALPVDYCAIRLTNHPPSLDLTADVPFFYMSTIHDYFERVNPDCWDGEVWAYLVSPANTANIRVGQTWK